MFIYISYNTKAKSCVCVYVYTACVSVFVRVCVTAGEEIDIHHTLADTMSFKQPG